MQAGTFSLKGSQLPELVGGLLASAKKKSSWGDVVVCCGADWSMADRCCEEAKLSKRALGG